MEGQLSRDVFVPDELVQFDSQQLPLTLHMKGLEGSGNGGVKKKVSGTYNNTDCTSTCTCAKLRPFKKNN